MNIRLKRSDIYFAGDDSHAFLPWIIGIMACLATLLLCLGLTVGGWVVDRSTTYASSFTVNIPASVPDMEERMPLIIKKLQETPGIISINPMETEELKTLLQPWLGSSETIEALPLPKVLDVNINTKTEVDYAELQASLSKIAEGTELDAHEIWVANFMRFSATVRMLMAFLAAAIIGGLALMIAFTSRASLKLHSRTVNLLHSVGAEDFYVMRQFQREAFWVTLRGTIPGCVLAGIAYAVAGHYMAGMQSSILPTLAMQQAHFALLLLMPLACGVVAWLTAGISVIKQLERVL